MMYQKYWYALVLTTCPAVGCGGEHSTSGEPDGPDGGEHSTSSEPDGPYYEKTCVQTACDSCLEQTSELCAECTALCRSPGAPSSCFSTCSSICSDRCPDACSGEACEEWATTVALPPPNPELYTQCMLFRTACAPQDGNARYCDMVARTHHSGAGQMMVCWAEHECQSSPECIPPIELYLGTVGTDLCARARQCDATCDSAIDISLDVKESLWRPQLRDGLRHCISEASCIEFKECANAYISILESSWQKLK